MAKGYDAHRSEILKDNPGISRTEAGRQATQRAQQEVTREHREYIDNQGKK